MRYRLEHLKNVRRKESNLEFQDELVTKNENEINMMSPLTWAYVGDSIYEMYIRTYLSNASNFNPHKLHIQSIKYVKAAAQADIVKKLELTDDEKEIVMLIKEDEKKHDEILRFIYSNLTGETIPMNMDNNPNMNSSNEELDYKKEIEQNFMDKVNAIAKYRKIMGAMPNSKMHTLFMSILTDEIRHSALYNYLIHKAHV